MDVTDVLRDRMQEPGGLEGMAALSILAHAAFVSLILLLPGAFGSHVVEQPQTVMTISLGSGVAGPQTGGATPLSGKPIQETTPPEEPKKPEPVRAPAAKTPEMTLPAQNAKAQKTPPTVVKEAPSDARGHTPTRGAETREGTAAAETGVRGQGFGLSTGGGQGAGSFLDVGDFCCPEYLGLIKQRIDSNWNVRAGASGEVVVKFTIQRDGRITQTMLEQSSGNAILDLRAQSAIQVTQRLPALPAAYPNSSLNVHYSFQFQR